MKQYFEILRRCPLFDDIADKDLLPMLRCLDAKVESFDKKYTIFAEGSAARHIGIVLSGSVQISQVDFYGNRTILSEAGTADLFGEAFACAEIQSIPISVTGCGPCEILLLNCRRILHACSNACEFHQQLIFNLMKILAMKNISFHQKIEITSRRTTREKLMTYLTLEAKKKNSSAFTIPFNRQELADFLEVDRSGLSAEISKLRKKGILESQKNSFKLL